MIYLFEFPSVGLLTISSLDELIDYLSIPVFSGKPNLEVFKSPFELIVISNLSLVLPCGLTMLMGFEDTLEGILSSVIIVYPTELFFLR